MASENDEEIGNEAMVLAKTDEPLERDGVACIQQNHLFMNWVAVQMGFRHFYAPKEAKIVRDVAENSLGGAGNAVYTRFLQQKEHGKIMPYAPKDAKVVGDVAQFSRGRAETAIYTGSSQENEHGKVAFNQTGQSDRCSVAGSVQTHALANQAIKHKNEPPPNQTEDHKVPPEQLSRQRIFLNSLSDYFTVTDNSATAAAAFGVEQTATVSAGAASSLSCLSCEKCNTTFTNANLLKLHQTCCKENTLYRCRWCGMVLATFLNLKWHLMAAHEKTCFQSHICLCCLYTLNDFKHHSRSHALIYWCKICSERTLSSRQLLRHEINAHEAKLSLRCNYCPFRTSIKGSLIWHIRSHQDMSLPFSCTTCGYRTTDKGILQRHIAAYHNGKSGQRCEGQLFVPRSVY